jgi:hypothetical protein
MRNFRSKLLVIFSLTLTLIFVFTATADAQKKKPRKKTYRAPAKVWITPITADKIKNDLTGEIIYRVPSEEAGDGWTNWQFSYNQSKQVEILQKNSYGNESTVEARIYAQKAIPNFDGSVDRLRGVARLYYQRSGSRWQLTRIENISLRHSDTGSDSPIYPTYTIPPTPAAATAIVPGGVTVPVAAGKFQSFSFRVADRAVVIGRFQARGGPGNDIEAYILDYDGFVNWSNNHSAPAYYNSGRLTVGTIKTLLSAGTYYLVFNNRYSPVDAKTVEVSVEMKTDNNSYDGTGRTYDPYGRGLTVNTISRVYAPDANPAPSYTPPSTPYTPTPNPSPRPIPTRTVPQTPDFGVEPYSSERILSDTFDVRQRKDRAFSFVVRNRGTVKGDFRVLDGDGKDIEVLIMTAEEYDSWSRYQEATLNYSSGRVTNGRIDAILNPGTYYLVFSNYFSSNRAKTIEADVYIEYLMK